VRADQGRSRGAGWRHPEQLEVGHHLAAHAVGQVPGSPRAGVTHSPCLDAEQSADRQRARQVYRDSPPRAGRGRRHPRPARKRRRCQGPRCPPGSPTPVLRGRPGRSASPPARPGSGCVRPPTPATAPPDLADRARSPRRAAPAGSRRPSVGVHLGAQHQPDRSRGDGVQFDHPPTVRGGWPRPGRPAPPPARPAPRPRPSPVVPYGSLGDLRVHAVNRLSAPGPPPPGVIA